MLGHCSIVLTADTETSVLPEVAHQAAEQVAALGLRAGRLVLGTDRHVARFASRAVADRHHLTAPQPPQRDEVTRRVEPVRTDRMQELRRLTRRPMWSATEAGARAYLRDVPDAQLHQVDTGHFARKDRLDEIAPRVAAFLDRVWSG